MVVIMNCFANAASKVYIWCLMLLTIGFCFCKESSDEVLCIASEREALLKFKHNLTDPSNRLLSWTPHSDCCKWLAVVCSNVTGHILELHLRSSPPPLDRWFTYAQYEAYERSRFGGDISSSLLDLKHLNYLDLSGNDFDGIPIPTFIGSLISLIYLNFSGAEFSGNIPHQIGNLSNLLYLDLGNNYYSDQRFNGKVPRQIRNLTNLVHLNLGGYLGQELFVEDLQWLWSLSSLQYLDLTSIDLSKVSDWLDVVHIFPHLKELHLAHCSLQYHNQLSKINFSSLVVLDLSYMVGSSFIPKWIFELKNLVSLLLPENNFEGPIPKNIQNLTLIENLDLSKNSLNSSIPNWLYGCTHLKLLDLGYNKLDGKISGAIGNLTSLITLDMSSNQLEGSLPTSLRNLCSLRELAISIDKCNQQIPEIFDILSGCVAQTLETLAITESKLSGHLTDQIGNFKNLFRLLLANNNIRGPLPRSLGKLSSLKFLDLGGNQFTGNPFEIIGQLPELLSLDIEDNQFQGTVSEGHLANLTSLKGLFASNNQLTLKVSPKWTPRFQLFFLSMDSWNLGPSFPTWIQSQKNLSSASLSNTRIFDSIPAWLWSSLSGAYDINLSHNHIYGEIPCRSMDPIAAEVIDLSSNNLAGQLPYLSPDVYHLDLSRNWFSGFITSFLCQRQESQKRLEFLNLASNNLSGDIPDCWLIWQNLVTVKLENNFFTGQIPKSMGSLPWLKYLQLRNNTLSGKFPVFPKNSSELICLDLGENKISGSIPLWIGERLLNLKVLRLRSNNFSGEIPHQICNLKFLQVLDLAQNNLSGHIPQCLNQMSAMMIKNDSSDSYIGCRGKNDTGYCMVTVVVWMKGREFEYGNILGLMISIDLSGNKLSGEIPSEITSLSQLVSLNLSRNVLRGRIPETIGNMALSESIDFSRNQLSGEIPESISKLNFLSKLDLSHNHLKGRIPTGTQLQTFDAVSFVGNDLCGPPLSINCSSPEIIPNADDKDKKGNGHEINWFFASMAYGFVVGFWAFVGPLLFIRSWRFAYYGWLDSMWCKLRYCWW